MKNITTRIFYLLCLLAFFASCNVVQMVDRKQRKKFDRKEITRHTFTRQGEKHYAHYTNNGKPKLMLLHGYGASGVGQYYRTALELRKEYDLILPDLLYCGYSHGDSTDFSIDAQVEHVKLLLDSLHIHEKITVIGNSYGGVVASYFAEKYPQLVNKLVVYDSPINFYTSTYADSLSKALEVESIRNLLSPLDVRENRISLGLVFHKQPYIPKFLRHQMVKYGSIPSRPTQVKLLEHLMQNEQKLNSHIFNWQCPVYIMWGEYDVLIPIETCNKIIACYNIPSSRIYIFKNAAHAANVEYPHEFVDAVRKIMNEK